MHQCEGYFEGNFLCGLIFIFQHAKITNRVMSFAQSDSSATILHSGKRKAQEKPVPSGLLLALIQRATAGEKK